MKLTSYGAALEVTGSNHLIEVNGKRILLDCGLFQGRRQEAFEKNQSFDYNPAEIDLLILSHAHIDHSGLIPLLIKDGFTGDILCTEATRHLCEVMLLDSAHIQEYDAEFYSKKLRKSDEGWGVNIEPLYTIEDAQNALEYFRPIPYDKKIRLYDGIYLTLREAGHVFGSAQVVLDIKDSEDKKDKTFLFTGDLGRCDLPIINDPFQVEKADYILTESTYGNRTHAPISEGIPELARIIKRTVRRGGKLIIPAFAFERTQELIYSIHILARDKQIPDNIPIFIDSPLATRITDIFSKHSEFYDNETKKDFPSRQTPFAMNMLKHVSTADESKALNYYQGPCIIISASGMCEAGRIRHHLKNNIEDPKNTIAIVGYMAENTLGRKLVDGHSMIKIFNQMYSVRADVVILESFSAHADMNDLDEYIGNVKGLKRILIAHGEEDQSGPMAERLNLNLGVSTHIMRPIESVDL